MKKQSKLGTFVKSEENVSFAYLTYLLIALFASDSIRRGALILS